MDEINIVLNLDWKNLIIGLFALIVVFVGVIKTYDYLKQRFGWETKKERAAREDHELLEKTAKRVEEVNNDSIAHDKKLETEMNQLQGTLDKVYEKLEKVEEERKKAEKARLKDRILQAYKYYRVKGEWNEMEKEAFDGLVERYLASSGNSFVHNIIIPESQTWKLI